MGEGIFLTRFLLPGFKLGGADSMNCDLILHPRVVLSNMLSLSHLALWMAKININVASPNEST